MEAGEAVVERARGADVDDLGDLGTLASAAETALAAAVLPSPVMSSSTPSGTYAASALVAATTSTVTCAPYDGRAVLHSGAESETADARESED